MIKSNFILRADTPIAHHSETMGNMSVLMRELVRCEDGELVRVPIITGDAMRNRIRSEVGNLLLSSILDDGDKISAEAIRFIFSGGVLAGKQAHHSVKSWIEAVRCWPGLGLLGGCCNGRIWPGALKVDDAVMLCSETKHLAVESHRDENTKSCRAYIEEVQRVRMDPANNPQFESIQVKTEYGDDISLMPRSFEQACRGSLWIWSMTLVSDDKLLEDLLKAAMMPLLSGKFTVGGKTATGHGRMSMVSAEITAADSVEARTRVTSHMKANKEDAIAYLKEVIA